MASRNLGTLTIDLIAKIGGFAKGMTEAERIADRTSRDIVRKQKQRAAEVEKAWGNLKTIGLGIAAAAGAAFIAINRVAGGIDALNDAADATGSSIENLSALEDVAERTGSSFDAVTAAVVKLNQGLKETDPKNPAAQALKAIGLSAEELRKLDPAEALRQVSVALSGYADDGQRARLVQELFGKSVREVGPFLKDLATQGQLNAKVTTEQALEAEKFRQNVSALEKNIKDAARSLVSDIIPALNSFIDKLKESSREVAQNGGFWSRIFKGLAAERVSDDLKRVTGQISSLQKDIDRQGATPLLAKRMQVLQAEAEQLTKDALAASDALKQTFSTPPPPRDGLRSLREIDNASLARPSAPDVPDAGKANKAAEEALATFRKTIEGRIKAAQDGLSTERDAYSFHERFLEQLYDQGLVDLRAFYAAQDETRRTALQATRVAIAAEIAEREKLLKSPLLKGADKESEREAVRNEIAAARAKLAAAERDFDQSVSQSALDRRRTAQVLREELQFLQADIKALAGDSSARDLLEIARKVKEAKQILRDNGKDESLANDLERLLVRETRRNKIREDLTRITREAQIEEERFLIAAEASGETRADVERRLGEIRQRALSQLAEQVKKAEELAAAADPNSPAVLFAKELRLELERAAAAADPLRQRLNEFADFAADTIGRSVTDAILDGDWKSAGRQISRDLARGILEEDFMKPLQDELRKFIRGGVSGSDSAGGSIVNSVLRGFGLGGGSANTVPGFAGGQFDIRSGTWSGSPSVSQTNAPTPERDILRQMEAATHGFEEVSRAATDLIPSFDDLGPSIESAMGAFDSLPDLLGNLFSSMNFGGGGGGAGDLLSTLGSFFMHRGGIAGVDGSATRYHTGGIAGLRPDEVPAILRKGEEVLTRSDPRHRANGSSTYSPTFNIPANVDKRTVQQVEAAAYRGAMRARGRGTG